MNTAPSRRPDPIAVIAVVVCVVAGLLILARVVPGPRGQLVTVLETGKVGTSKQTAPDDLP